MMLFGALAGSEMAPNSMFATLPVALMVIGLFISVMPATKLMARFGRKPIFILAILLTSSSGLLGSFAVSIGHFELLCLASILLGMSGAINAQYRFAAMESVAPELAASAASKILLGGLIAAIVGPDLALYMNGLFEVNYVGAFLAMSVLAITGLVFISGYQPVEVKDNQQVQTLNIRKRREVLANPLIWVAILGAAVAFAMMSFIMTATPLHMHHHEHYSLADTKWVIQSHIMAMYLPSLVSGWLFAKFGIRNMMLAGLFIYALTLVMGFYSEVFSHYWLTLVLLGIGWNFLFVGATALLPKCYNEGEGFKVQGINDTLVFGVQASVTLGAGWVLAVLGWQSLLLSCIPLLIIMLMAFAVARKSSYS